MELEGKVAVVTGGAGNLGSASAVRMAAEGAAVVVCDRAGSDIEGVVARISAAGGRAIGHEVDVSDEGEVRQMIDVTVREYGRLDSLINTAATVRDSGIVLAGMEVEQWDHIMAVNVRGPMLGSKYAIPAMLAKGGGSIVNFTSTNAYFGDVTRIAYATSKAALLGLTRSVATAYGKQGIRCNAIAPHSTWAESTQERLGHDWVELVERTLLSPRLGVPDDIAHMVVYLACDKSVFITGQTIFVDGGGTAHQPWVGVK